MRYPIAAPELSGNELEYVQRCLQSTWISSSGSFLAEFEAQVAARAGCPHGVATCNGTVALHLALAGLGVQPGDEVIVPTLTFVATANAVAYCGATPVFADSDAGTWCVSPESIERLIGPRTRGIIPVHLYGVPCDMDAILAVARRHGLWVIEDCAEAHGATWKGQPVGSLGDAAAFSFFGNKVVTTGEGGMVVTKDDALAAKLRLLRGQGMDPTQRYWHVEVGFNYRMTNLAAAIGVAQMERFDALLAARASLAEWYYPRLRAIDGVSLAQGVDIPGAVLWMCSVLLPGRDHREPLRQLMAQKGVETRPVFYPVHHFPMYRDCPSDAGCPVASDLSYRGISLPTAPYLGEADVRYITTELREAVHAVAGPARRAA